MLPATLGTFYRPCMTFSKADRGTQGQSYTSKPPVHTKGTSVGNPSEIVGLEKEAKAGLALFWALSGHENLKYLFFLLFLS